MIRRTRRGMRPKAIQARQITIIPGEAKPAGPERPVLNAAVPGGVNHDAMLDVKAV